MGSEFRFAIIIIAQCKFVHILIELQMSKKSITQPVKWNFQENRFSKS